MNSQAVQSSIETSRQLPTGHWPVVIIGAGVAGSMAALLCSRAGLRTLLVDRQAFPRHKVCGCCLNAAAVRLLDHAGILPTLSIHSGQWLGTTRFFLDGRAASVTIPQALAISRHRLDHQLIQSAKESGCQFHDRTDAIVMPNAANDVRSNPGAPEALRQLRLHAVTSADLEAADAYTTVTAEVVLVCDGLGQPGLRQLDEFNSTALSGSRLGLGAVVPRTEEDRHFQPGVIHMAVSRHGYAGTVEIEEQSLNIAAAVDGAYLKTKKNATAALLALFHESGLRPPAALSSALVRGTPSLTRSSSAVAARRIFLLGDSAGYVEPFTGEGMAWAFEAAYAVIPLVQQTIDQGWSPDLISLWNSTYGNRVGRRQRICRLLSAGLRHPWLLHPMLTACRLAPSVASALAGHMNRITGKQELK